MNKNLIAGVIALLVVGLMGLMVVQAMWLKGAVKVRNQRFDSVVAEAMSEISYRIQEIGFQAEMKDLFTHREMLIDQFGEDFETTEIASYTTVQGNKQYHHVKVNNIIDTVISIENNEEGSKFMYTKEYAHVEEEGQLPMWKLGVNIDETPVAITISPEEIKRTILEQKEALSRMLYKQMFNLRPFLDIIDTVALEGIIKEVLISHGIETDFEFGIVEADKNNFVYASSKACLKDLYKSKYGVEVSNSSFFKLSKYLIVAFPNKNKYLLNSFWLPLSSSGLFLMMLMASFAIALFIIFRQKRLSDMKTDFINNMTHELKTPIATISLASEMLKDNTIAAKNENRLKYANVIFDENKRLANQVEKVLQIAKIEKGEVVLNKSEIDVHQLINTALNQFQIQTETRGGRIERNLNAKNSIVKVDEMHMTNVLNNLLDNAVKYNVNQPEIVVTTLDANGGIKLVIGDNGIGMKKEELKRIFDKFYRISKGDVHDVKGFGLGLSYVSTIVEKHGGSIEARSTIGAGSEFELFIPFKNKKDEK